MGQCAIQDEELLFQLRKGLSQLPGRYLPSLDRQESPCAREVD